MPVPGIGSTFRILADVRNISTSFVTTPHTVDDVEHFREITENSKRVHLPLSFLQWQF